MTGNYGEPVGKVLLPAGNEYREYNVYQVDGEYYYHLGDVAQTSNGFVTLDAALRDQITPV